MLLLVASHSCMTPPSVTADATSKTCRHASQLAGHVSHVTWLNTCPPGVFPHVHPDTRKIPTLSHPCIIVYDMFFNY